MPPVFARHASLSMLVLSLALEAPANAQAEAPNILVTSRNTDEVLRYDGDTGAFLGVFASGGGLDNPVGLTFGPDGNLYVASANTMSVLRFDGATGAYLNVFAEGAAMGSPRNLNFGPDGHLYVASGDLDRIVRYDGGTGAFLDVFASGGNLNGPTSFTFGPDGALYVASVSNDRVKKYDGETGAYLGNFISSRVDAPHDVGFGPDGRFYVVSANLAQVRAFDPVTGAFLQNYTSGAALGFALGMQWDGSGHFYVANQGADEVRRYDAATGVLESVLVTPGAGGLDAPLFLAFEPTPVPQIEEAVPSVAGVRNWLRISGFEPGRKAYLMVGVRTPTMQVLPCGLQRGLAMPMVLHTMSLDESGSGVLGGVVPLALLGVTLDLQAIAPRSCQFSAVRSVTF